MGLVKIQSEIDEGMQKGCSQGRQPACYLLPSLTAGRWIKERDFNDFVGINLDFSAIQFLFPSVSLLRVFLVSG